MGTTTAHERVSRIVECERLAEEHQTRSERYRWQAAELHRGRACGGQEPAAASRGDRQGREACPG